MTMLDKQDAYALASFVERNQETIVNALRVYAEGMIQAAADAMRAHEAGQSDPAVKAGQDASIMTNNGYRQSGNLFFQSAEKAQQVADEIDRIIDGDDSPDAGE